MRPPRPFVPEPVDPEAVSPAAPFRAYKQFGLVLLCAAWVALGLAGHDPWKTEDATSIGVAAEMARAGDFVVPTLGGEPYVPRPPLAYIGGALAIGVFAPPLQVHNAARMIVGIALAVVLVATGFASRELNGRAFRWLPVLILVGSIGFWDRAHVLSPELFVTVGVALALYGFALALRRPAWGGVALGAGVAVAFLGRGFNGGLSEPGVVIPGVLALVLLASLLAMPEARLVNALPLLAPLALLAALEVDSLKRGFSGALDWFGILTFGLLAMLMWGLWIDAYVNGMPANVARLFRDTETGYRPSFHLGTMLAATGLTVLWVVLVRPARRSNRRAILNWAAGVTLIWGLATTIWLPYLDSRRSYRWTVENVAMRVPRDACLASRNLGEPQRAVFRYFAGIDTVREEVRADHGCRLLVVQYGRVAGEPEPLAGWTAIWSGARRGDDTERFVLYKRDP